MQMRACACACACVYIDNIASYLLPSDTRESSSSTAVHMSLSDCLETDAFSRKNNTTQKEENKHEYCELYTREIISYHEVNEKADRKSLTSLSVEQARRIPPINKSRYVNLLFARRCSCVCVS